MSTDWEYLGSIQNGVGQFESKALVAWETPVTLITLLTVPVILVHSYVLKQLGLIIESLEYSYVSNQCQPNVLKKTYIVCTLVKEKYNKANKYIQYSKQTHIYM